MHSRHQNHTVDTTNGPSQPTPGLLSRGLDSLIDRIAPCSWQAHAGYHSVDTHQRSSRAGSGRAPLYTPEERVRRDNTVWTLVQGILAPVQFLACIISLILVVRYLASGSGEVAATVSILVKTGLLFTIMVTGAIWEKVVFGRYLFAPAFFWEDVVSMLVIALHVGYVAALLLNIGTTSEQMLLALAAYTAYVINAVQFVWKLRQARLDMALVAPAQPQFGRAA